MTASTTNPKADDSNPKPTPLPSVDILDDGAVWTPEIDNLLQSIVEQIRLDQPGMIVNGPQRNGKSRACNYVAAVLSEAVGYPVTTFTWTISESDLPPKARVFIQDRLYQSDCSAITHRDFSVLRNRLISHMCERANSEGARRIVIIVDEAQNLWRADYGALVFIFNEIERRGLRPFFLLVGQPELGKQAEQWMTEDAQQMVGRFSTRTHSYMGIHLDDLEQVLEGFDDDAAGPESTAAFRTSPKAYAEGWRVAELAPVIRDAVKSIAAAQNVQESVRLPMQYLRSCLLSVLYRIVQTGMNPRTFQLADAVDCVRSSNFAKVLQFYVRTSSSGAPELRGVPTSNNPGKPIDAKDATPPRQKRQTGRQDPDQREAA